MNFYFCQHTFIYTLLTVVDLHIKWHNDSQDDLFKDHFSPFLIFVCLYFLSWRSFSVRQFAYLWNVIWSFQKNGIHAAAAVPSLQTISLPWCSQREVCVCHTALCTSLCGRQSLVVFGPLSQSIIVVSVDLLCYSSHIPLDQSSHSLTPIVLIHSGPSQSKASCSFMCLST